MAHDAATQASVVWDPLNGENEFRILALASRADGEQLSAELKKVTLESMSNKYMALSYRWGSMPSEIIKCSGRTVLITHNLHSALCRLRQPTQALYIWVDALCVQQGSDETSLYERSHQIPLMKHIYGNALRVIVDLGDDDGTLATCVEGINAILRTPQDLRRKLHLQTNPQEYLKLPPFADPMWSAMERFLSRPWFQRIWCVQEAVLAKDIRVIFGAHSITFEQLVSAASVYLIVSSKAGSHEHQTRTWDISKFQTPLFATQSLLGTFQMRKAQLAGKDSPLVSLCQLMIMTMGQQATDRRDRVYGLYGMLGPEFAEQFAVDYGESTAKLGTRLSEFLLRNGNGVWGLVHCCTLGKNQESWSIDLHELGERFQLDPLYSSTQHNGTNVVYAAGGTPAAADIRRHPSPGCLAVRGVIVDTVENMTEPIDTDWESLLDFRNRPRITPARLTSYVKRFLAMIQWAQQFATEDRTDAADAQPSKGWRQKLRAVVQRAPATDKDSSPLWRTLIANFNPHADDVALKDEHGHPKEGFGANFKMLVAYTQTIADADADFETMTDADFETRYFMPPGAVKYWTAAAAPLLIRKLIRTRHGRFGLCPIACETKDVIAVFVGVPVPFVLRPDGDSGGYRVIGISYIHGLMNGEALQRGLSIQDILLR